MPEIIDLTALNSRPSSAAGANPPDAGDEASLPPNKPLRRKGSKKRKRNPLPIESETSTDTNANGNASGSADGVNHTEGKEEEEGELVEEDVKLHVAPDAIAEVRMERRTRKRSQKRAKAEAKATAEPEADPDTNGARDGSPELLQFYVDVAPAAVSDPISAPNHKPPTLDAHAAEPDPAAATSSLLLPAHVSVLPAENGMTTHVEIIVAPSPDSDDEGAIEYLDYDDRKAPDVRYFTESQEASIPTRLVCKRCGAENEHRTAECPVLICLTCGARDEHGTRSCPISKTCFNCGMKGHISQTCPSKYSRARRAADAYDDCDRCGASTHREVECPTLWRIYEYVTEAERTSILEHREEKGKLKVGEGGEGYIATDEWCYNCGESGHLGDDCPQRRERPSDMSAFSAYNTMSGPFFDPDAAPLPRSSKRARRSWEEDGAALPDGWGANLPQNVGQQGRQKERARMQARAAASRDEDDPDDWFGNARNARSRGMPRPLPPRPAPLPPRPAPSGSSQSRGSSRRDAAAAENYFDPGRKDPTRTTTSKPEPFKLEIKGAAKRFQALGELEDAPKAPVLDTLRSGPWHDDRARERDYGHDRVRNEGGRDRRQEKDRERNRDRDDRGREKKHHGRHSRGDRDRGRSASSNKPRYNGGYSR